MLPDRSQTVVRTLLILAALVVVIAGMRASQAMLVPFLLSLFIAVISVPPMYWLQRRGLPTAAAIAIVLVGIVGVTLLFVVLAGTSLDDFYRALPGYQERLQGELGGLIGWLNARGIELPRETLLSVIDPGAAMRLATNVLAGVGNVMTNALLIVLTVVFMLFEASSFPHKIGLAVDDPAKTFAHFAAFSENLKRYAVIKTLVSLATGAVIAVWLTILGVDYPLLWGALAFLLNYIPNIGSIIAAVPAVLLALLQFGWGPAALTAAGYVVVNMVMGNIVEPRYMGRGLGLSTLVVFLSLVFWGWVLGPVGMILSVPLTMTAKLALDANEETRWIAILLGPDIEPAATESA